MRWSGEDGLVENKNYKGFLVVISWNGSGVGSDHSEVLSMDEWASF
jgi:hypothetical protein